MRRALASLLAALMLTSSLGAAGPDQGGEPLPVMAAQDQYKPGLPGPDQSQPVSPGPDQAKPGLPGPDPDPRVIPAPEETEALPPPRSPKARRAEDLAALAGIAGGMALSAFGISLFFRGAGDGLDAQAMHRGLGIALSGSLIAAFCAVFRSPRDSLPE